MTTRTYEEKQALVNKWFTKDQLTELQGIDKTPLVKVHEYSAEDLKTCAYSFMMGVADEKEDISERINSFLDDYSNDVFLIDLLDSLYNNVDVFFINDGEYPEEITLTKGDIFKLTRKTHNLVELMKLLVQLSTSADRVGYLEKK